LLSDSKNGETHYYLGLSKLKLYDQNNTNNITTTSKWCTQITGACYRLTSIQLKEICADFTNSIQYGHTISPDYLSLCGELKEATNLEKYKPRIHIGPRGGRYTMSSNGNKIYLPR
jgi:hypothetical protein